MKRIFCVFLVLAVVSCASDDNKTIGDERIGRDGWMLFPAITTVGMDVLAFKMDAYEFVSHNLPTSVSESIPDGKFLLTSLYKHNVLARSYEFRVSSHNQKMQRAERLQIDYLGPNPLQEGGKYKIGELKSKEDIGLVTVVFQNYRAPVERVYYSAIEGEMEVLKLDTVAKVISGTFHFSAVMKTTNDTIKIKDGRFDLSYSDHY